MNLNNLNLLGDGEVNKPKNSNFNKDFTIMALFKNLRVSKFTMFLSNIWQKFVFALALDHQNDIQTPAKIILI